MAERAGRAVERRDARLALVRHPKAHHHDHGQDGPCAPPRGLRTTTPISQPGTDRPTGGTRISDRRGRPGQRTGRNIDKVAAAPVLLTLVYYGLRDGHIRAPRRCTRPAAAGRGVKPASHHPRTPVLIRKWPGTGERDHRLSGMVVPSRGRASEAQAAGSKVTLKPRASSWRMWLPFYPLRHRRAPVLLGPLRPGTVREERTHRPGRPPGRPRWCRCDDWWWSARWLRRTSKPKSLSGSRQTECTWLTSRWVLSYSASSRGPCSR